MIGYGYRDDAVSFSGGCGKMHGTPNRGRGMTGPIFMAWRLTEDPYSRLLVAERG